MATRNTSNDIDTDVHETAEECIDAEQNLDHTDEDPEAYFADQMYVIPTTCSECGRAFEFNYELQSQSHLPDGHDGTEEEIVNEY